MGPHGSAWNEALEVLARNAEAADGRSLWPEASWEALPRAGVLGWSIPGQYGGSSLEAVELLTGLESLAQACLTTCFLLSQREAACRRIRDSANAELRQMLLPALVEGKCFATVGLSQLTTSRQHGPAALV